MKHLIITLMLLLNSGILLCQYDVIDDSTFSEDGVSILPFSLSARQGMILQPDGKLVLLVWQHLPNIDPLFAVARLNTDGSLDSSYNNTGINNESLPYDGYSNPIGILLPNNDFVIGGSDHFTPWYSRNVVLGKYLENGTMDPLFGNGGTAILTLDSFNMRHEDLKLYKDTSLLVLVSASFSPNDNSPDINKNLLYKLKLNGSIDSTFATNGILDIPLSALSFVQKMAISDDGSIYMMGYAPDGFPDTKVVKFNADWTLDPGFQYVSAGLDSYFSNIGVDGDGKLLAISTKHTTGFRLARLMPDGTLDNSFSKDGVIEESFNLIGVEFGVGGGIGPMIEQPDGKLLFSVGGGAMAFRVNPNGTMDYSFDLDGIVQKVNGMDPFTLISYPSSGMALQPDKKILFMTATEAGFIKILRLITRP
ncbi:MAG: hypothetical protein H7246_07630 [Phycisphaerae bacterium]|nr:hypothetical protein [Saprospiraceae bacterium]